LQCRHPPADALDLGDRGGDHARVSEEQQEAILKVTAALSKPLESGTKDVVGG